MLTPTFTTEAKFCEHGELLVPWTRDKELFVDPGFVRPNRSALACLGIQTVAPATVWEKYIENNLVRLFRAFPTLSGFFRSCSKHVNAYPRAEMLTSKRTSPRNWKRIRLDDTIE